MRRIAPLAALLAVLAGCAPKPAAEAPAAPAGPVEVRQRWTGCPADARAGAEPLELPRLPADFTPAEVVVCADEPQKRADGGEDLVRVEKRGSDVEALTRALRLSDQPRTTGACTADLPGVQWFAVLDAAGRWLRPGIAADACGKLRIEARQAVQQLRLNTVSSTVLGETISSAAAASGCEQHWAELVSAVAGEPSHTETTFDAPKGEVRLCLYRVPIQEQGTGKPAGTFERGGVLAPQRWSALREDLLKVEPAKPPAPCTTPAARFALIRATDGVGGEIYAELDGCHRLLATPPSGNALRQGDAALAQRIEGAL
ncbi:hypothetical protein [Dactylosporangium sp. CA-233914]|uniref:hypothetical protein n=1 Tax=Dactylosporangium sp. CA-233914 TaxID=3239934 RepID=UPI003D8E6011